MDRVLYFVTVISVLIASVSVVLAALTAINALYYSLGRQTEHARSKKRSCAIKTQLVLIGIWDVICALISIIVFLPIYLTVGMIIYVYTHEAPIDIVNVLGKGGEKVSIYRFRTRCTRGDEKFKAIGKFLRKSGLSELPLLFNIVKRDISVFGLVRMEYNELPSIQEYVPNISNPYMQCRPGLVSIRELRWNVMPAKADAKEYYEYIDKINKEFIEKQSIGYVLRMLCRVIVMTFRPYDHA